MIINANITGIDGTISALQQKGAAAPGALHNAIEHVAIALRDSMVKYVGAGHPDHPNVQTGRLRSSITYSFQGENTAYVGSNVDYAEYVEYGHRTAKPYPFVRPALDEVVQSGQAQQLVSDAFSLEVVG